MKVEVSILGHRHVAREGRATKRGEIHVQLNVPGDAERVRYRPRGVHLPRVALAVSNRQCKEPEALSLRHCRRGVGVESAAQEDHGRHLRFVISDL